jgi:uncharacterized membrane protein YebE (DUF533 family)
MNCKKFMFIFLLAASSFMIASDPNQCKKSLLVVFGTYSALSLLEVAVPMKSPASSDTFIGMGGIAAYAALIANNDTVSGIVAAGLIGYNVYARSQRKKQDLKSEK